MKLADKLGFQVPAFLTGIRRLSDGGLGINFHTNELDDEEMIAINQYFQKFGWLMFRENEFTPEEIPVEDADFEGKSASQRLRAVLFVWWKQKPEGEFEEFYKKRMEKIISMVKNKLVPDSRM